MHRNPYEPPREESREAELAKPKTKRQLHPLLQFVIVAVVAVPVAFAVVYAVLVLAVWASGL